MKKLIVILITVMLVSNAYAWNSDNKPRKIYGGQVDSYGHSRNNKQKNYESSYGNTYKYDLSKPGDRIRYNVDPRAQLRDNLHKKTNPRVRLEESLGEYGGGIIRD